MTRTVVVEGYTYERYLGYTYKKNRRGKRERVHHFKTVVVPGYSYVVKIVSRKRRKPATVSPKRRKAAPPKPAAKPKAKPAPKPKAKRKPKSKPKPAPVVEEFQTPKGWLKAGEWQDSLEQWADKKDFEISWDGDLYKKSPANDWISRDLFIWPTPKYPRGLRLTKYPEVGTKIFYMARVWVLIEHTQDEEMFVWTRTARLRREMDYDEAAAEIPRLVAAIESDLEAFTYLAFRGLVGFTLYTTGTHATRRKKKEGTN